MVCSAIKIKSALGIILLLILYVSVHQLKLYDKLEIKSHFLNLSIHRENTKEKAYDLCDQRAKHLMGTRVLSYTLYGSWAVLPSKFLSLENIADEAKSSSIYHSWSIRVYHDNALSVKLRDDLKSRHANIIFCNISNIFSFKALSHINRMEWRFLPFGDPTVDIFCSRDVDSPLLKRESDAVNQWLLSDKFFHVMRDNPEHNTEIMGGLFCVRPQRNRALADRVFLVLKKKFNRRKKKNGKVMDPKKGSDQNLLRKVVWPLVKHETLQHDSYLCKDYGNKNTRITPYPSKRINSSSGFIGCPRPCDGGVPPCPPICRPPNHQDWIYC